MQLFVLIYQIRNAVLLLLIFHLMNILVINVYAKLGFQIEQEIPKKVWDAYEQLVELGYHKYVIE